jgi:hypothetical protein
MEQTRRDTRDESPTRIPQRDLGTPRGGQSRGASLARIGTPSEERSSFAESAPRMVTGEAEQAHARAEVPAWVLLHVEARTRGFRSALAFRRWCRRRGVPIRPDGRKQWVAPQDVDRAVATIPPESTPCEDAATTALDPVASGVRDLMLHAGRRR